MIDTVLSTRDDYPAPIDLAALDAYIEYIGPREGELRWQAVEWETDLWEARRLAVKLEKPIFLWAMNGHPLGCV